MTDELVEFEKEEEKRLRERVENTDDEMSLVEARPKSTPEKVRVIYCVCSVVFVL